MIRVFVNDSEIFIADKDFSYVEYNSVLDATKSRGGLTLDIDVPLNCAENMRVYDNVARLNARGLSAVRRVKVYHDAKLIIDGIEKILEFNSKKVKIQVLTDNSEVNNISNGKKLRELDLGNIPTLSPTAAAWTLITGYPESNWVCPTMMAKYLVCPSYWDNVPRIFNEFDGSTMWGNYSLKSYTTIIPQPYLLYVLEKVLNAIGYNIKNNSLLEDKFAYRLYIVHGITAGKLNLILPDWTVEEFLLEIQKMFNVVFKFDNNSGTVDIINTQHYYRNYSSVYEVKDDMIVYDDQSPSVKFEDVDMEAMDYTNVKYALPKDNKYYAYTDLDDDVLSLCEERFINLNITEERVNYNKPYIYSGYNGKFIMRKNAGYFGEETPEYYHNIMQFQHSSKDNKNETELRIIPALGALYTIDAYYGQNGEININPLVSIPFAMFNSFNVMASETTVDEGFNEWIQNGVSDEIMASNNTIMVAQYLGMRHTIYHDTEDMTVQNALNNARYPMSYIFNPMSGGKYEESGFWTREMANILFREGLIRDSDISFNLETRKQNGLSTIGIYEQGKVYKFKIYTERILDRADAFKIFGNMYIPVKLEYSFNTKVMRPYVEGEFVKMKL